MLETHLAAYRWGKLQFLKGSDIDIIEYFGDVIKKEIEEMSFDHLFRRSWKQQNERTKT